MVPLYTIGEAATFVNVPASTFRNWARPALAPGPRSPALVTSMLQAGREARVPFIGLAEGMVLAAFRCAGVPLQRIRPALLRLDQEMGIAHALASRRLYTVGAEVLYDYPDMVAETSVNNLVVVRSGQRVFSDVVRQYLQRITYAVDGWAQTIRLPAYENAVVLVDPERAFGRPLLEHSGARLEDIIDRFAAGDSLADLSRDFAAAEKEIEDVIRAAIRPAAA